MKKFVFLFVGAELKPGDGSPLTQEYMRKWGEWAAGLAQSGALESGLPLEWSGKTVSKEGAEDLSLLPLDIGGYMIINAESMDAAVEIAKGAPNVALGGRIVVRPCLDVPM
ncbi:MAG: YciI family protein [Dehalococcoidia bacterium]